MKSEPLPTHVAMLRRFEPVIRYTKGERFFPFDVERYIQQCSLWVQRPRELPHLLVSQGELTPEKLTEPRRDGFGAVYFLKFIDPLDLIELAKLSLNEAVKTFTHRDLGERFHAGRGRLARVGYTSRLVDALFSLTLYLRGRVPGDTAAAAALMYHRMQGGEEQYYYYGRVLRDQNWVVLQYWFFYPFNNWRSGFFGVNDHEGDWEMISVYCAEEEGDPTLPPECRLRPHWVAYASHDYSGDDLRRRWDDPELEKVVDEDGGEHPVVYAGAGSHASYFAPGEYLTELELPFLAPLIRVLEQIQKVWVALMRQSGVRATRKEIHVFRVPFVDYARGDGLSIGPGQPRSWNPLRLDDDTGWAVNYRGLWGLYARDPVAGENAPAGPVYNRDGSVRRSWFDPLGWAGLDKVPPPDEALAVLYRQRLEVQENCRSLQEQIAVQFVELQGLGVEAASMEGVAHLAHAYAQTRSQIATLSQELGRLRSQLTVEQAKLQTFDQHEQRLKKGEHGPLRAHIRRPHTPSSDIDLRLGRLAESFAAVSIGLTMISIVLLILFARQYLVFGLAAMIGLLIFVEAGFRRQLSRLVSSLVTGLAIVSAFILLFEFFWTVVVVIVLLTGLWIMWENLREIRM